MIKKNALSRVLGNKEAEKMEDEELDKEQELSEQNKKNERKESKINMMASMTGSDKRKKFKKR